MADLRRRNQAKKFPGSHFQNFGVHSGQHGKELLPPPASHHVGTADIVLQCAGHGLKQQISRFVAELIVHFFKIVQIDEQDSEGHAVTKEKVHSLS